MKKWRYRWLRNCVSRRDGQEATKAMLFGPNKWANCPSGFAHFPAENLKWSMGFYADKADNPWRVIAEQSNDGKTIVVRWHVDNWAYDHMHWEELDIPFEPHASEETVKKSLKALLTLHLDIRAKNDLGGD